MTINRETEKARWQSARDAWAWAGEVDDIRWALLRVDETHLLHTKAAALLLRNASDLLFTRAEREVTPRRFEIWRFRVFFWFVVVSGEFVSDWVWGRPITVGRAIGNLVYGTIVAVLGLVLGKKWAARSRRRLLGAGPTTPATSDNVADYPCPPATESYAYLTHAAWRAGVLAQASRLLLLPSRLEAARDREDFRVDVSLAALYLYGAMELLNSLAEYVRSADRSGGEKRGELR